MADRRTVESGLMVVLTLVLVLAPAGLVLAQDGAGSGADQEAMMAAWERAMTPGAPHAALARMTGEFTLTVTSYMEPGAEPMVSTATATRTMVMGGRVLEETVHGTFMGQPFEGRGLTGYDNVGERWWGAWVDTMSTGLMTTTGEWDDESGIGTFWGETIDPTTGNLLKVRTEMQRLEGGNERMESFMVTPEGEFKSMEILYERK